MTTATATYRLQQTFPDGAPVPIVPMPAQSATGNPYTDALLDLAAILVRNPAARRDYSYRVLDESGAVVATEGDAVVEQLRAALDGTDCGNEARRAAAVTAGLPDA